MNRIIYLAGLLVCVFGLSGTASAAGIRLAAHGGLMQLKVDDAIMEEEAKGHYQFGGSLKYGISSIFDVGLRADYLMYSDTNTDNSEIIITSLPVFAVISWHTNGQLRLAVEAGAGYDFVGKYSIGAVIYKGSHFAVLGNMKLGYALASWFIPFVEGGYMLNSWGAGKLLKEGDAAVSANPTAAFAFGGLYSVIGFNLVF